MTMLDASQRCHRLGHFVLPKCHAVITLHVFLVPLNAFSQLYNKYFSDLAQLILTSIRKACPFPGAWIRDYSSLGQPFVKNVLSFWAIPERGSISLSPYKFVLLSTLML